VNLAGRRLRISELNLLISDPIWVAVLGFCDITNELSLASARDTSWEVEKILL
jgi:hypothetical protein